MAMFCIKPSFEVCNQVTEKKIESVLHKYRQMSEREIGPNFSALVASVFSDPCVPKVVTNQNVVCAD